MVPRRRRPTRLHVLLSLIAVLALAWTFTGPDSGTVAAQQSNFMGGNPTRMDSAKVSTLRLKFPAGSRSNWHTHSWGQLLMVEEGRGRTQERGKPVREVLPWQPWFTAAGVEHWHGAALDQDMVQMTIYEGDVKWLEPVGDKEYRATPAR
jgi:quercetin dioxygenase-like cupin family protein